MSVIVNARDLGEDRDAALAFELVGVHDAVGDGFVVTKNAALLQKSVDQRRLAVVNVRDDRDVSNVGVTCGLQSYIFS